MVNYKYNINSIMLLII